ncbi:putative cystathionine gamma-synthase [Lachnellula suecica]|uniref:Putative cystathionine gamma-synthase n=1 Tax=Lachnellula suecica TaxID=602035 RepID=A0A8T9CI50_9HELO|nr:putative cystathionine gamma-synthase [Lachnellula suecica]
MSATIETAFGCALPPAQRHAITFHLPGWANMMRFVQRDQTLMKEFQSVYPRVFLNTDVKNLATAICKHAEAPEGQTCFVFTSPVSAAEFKEFAIDTRRGENVLSPEDISIRIFDVHVRLYAAFFPAMKTPAVVSFWQCSGAGVTSRIAEECLDRIDQLHEITDDSPPPKVEASPAQAQIRDRIAGLLERAPVGPPRKAKVAPNDVYLFQNGMASIYGVHRYLLKKHNGGSVLFGYAFHSTVHVFEDFGPDFKLLGLGTDEEADELERYLESELKEGRKVQAIWTEFPANPLIITPNLGRLRKLADKYECLLVVDDTVGSFCNVDVLGVADILISSLTKSFSGYADVMGASAVLNPSGSRYAELRSMFQEFYRNDFCNPDAIVLEHNSRDYLARSKILNNNALRLAEYLQAKAADPNSTVTKVYYTTTSISLPHYKERMRPVTEDFTPGYGCLLSFEFETLEAMAAFYDNVNVHIGPHLGAHLTLVLPYVLGLYGQELESVAPYDLRPAQFRVAPGLEDTEKLIKDFEVGIAAADATRGQPTFPVTVT